MVTRTNVGYRQDLVPCAEDARDSDRRVPGPLHRLDDVLAVLGTGPGSIILWTRDCASDVQYKLNWEMTDVHQLLGDGGHSGKVPWLRLVLSAADRPGGCLRLLLAGAVGMEQFCQTIIEH